MDRRDRLCNCNILEPWISQDTGHDSRHQVALRDSSRDNELGSVDCRSKPLVIRPLHKTDSTCFVCPKLPETPLSLIQNVHVHLLECFRDFRLNLETFHSLKTLVVHILPDLDIQNTNFSVLNDNQVYEFAAAYLYDHRRNRQFRDNLSRLHQNEGRPKKFSLRAHLKGTDYLTFIIVDLDTRTVERGIRCIPPIFFQSSREKSLRNELVPGIRIPKPCHPSHGDDALRGISLNWLRRGGPNLVGLSGPWYDPALGLSGPWYDPEYCRLYRHFKYQQQLKASPHTAYRHYADSSEC